MTLLTLFNFNNMTNSRNSTLLAYVQHQILYRGVKRIGLKSLNKIKALIDALINNCCLPYLPPFSNSFVTTVYNFLKTMQNKKFVPQLKIVQAFVNHAIACCS